MRKGKIVLPLVTFLMLTTAGTGIWVFSTGRKAPSANQEAVAGSSTGSVKPSPTLSEATPSGETNLTPVPSKVAQAFFLELFSPEEGMITKTAKIEVKGRASVGAEVFVNEMQVYPDKNGDFKKEIVLEEGENHIFITAGNEQGDSEVERVVFFEKK